MKNLTAALFFASLLTLNLYAQWQKSGEFNSLISSLLTFDNHLFAGTSFGLFRSTDGGLSWDSVASIPALVLAESNNKLYAGSFGVHISSNNGTNWTQTGLADCLVSDIELQGINIFAGTMGNGIGGIVGRGVFLSTDHGASWQPRNNGIEYSDIRGIDLTDSRFVAASVISSNPYQYPGILYSQDYGLTWALNVTGLPDAITQDAVFSGESIYTIVNNYGGLYRSTDNGQSWHLRNNGFPQKIPGVLINYTDANKNCWLFAGCSNGIVYFNKNDEADWHDISGDLPVIGSVLSLAASDHYLIAGIENTLWRRPMSDITSSEYQLPLITTFDLSQNYPNPFNPSTSIKYSIGDPVNVKIKIYDLLGREVCTLVDEEKYSGTYTVDFMAEGLSSGIYFYSMKAGSFLETKKILLQK